MKSIKEQIEEAAEKFANIESIPHTKREYPAWMYSIADFKHGAEYGFKLAISMFRDQKNFIVVDDDDPVLDAAIDWLEKQLKGGEK